MQQTQQFPRFWQGISSALLLVVELRKRLLNLSSDLNGMLAIHERAFVHPRTVTRRLATLAGASQQLRPVGEGTALQRFDRMYRAAVSKKKWALFVTWLAKSQQRRPAAQVATLELRPSDTEMLRESSYVLAADINKALLLAASYAAGLAQEAHARVYPESGNFRQLSALISRAESLAPESKQS